MSLFLLLSRCSSSQVAHTLEVCLIHNPLNQGSERIGQPLPLHLSDGFTKRESREIGHATRNRNPVTREG